MPCPVPGAEEVALLQAIKDSDPVDNAIRQVYADWLLDQGRNEQADFVRYQKDHDDPFSAYLDPGRWTKEGQTARELAAWMLRDWVGPGPASCNVQFRRGLLHAVIPVPLFLRGRYGAGLEDCRCAGWVETIELIDVTEDSLMRLPAALAGATERLAIRGTDLTPSGGALLAKVPRLESVDLEDVPLAALAKVPRLRRLVVRLPDFSGVNLAPLANLADLRCVCLENVGPGGDEALAPLLTLIGLRHLSINGSVSLTDAFLSGLASLVNLRFLSLTGARSFGTGALTRLRQALPGCVIRTGAIPF
jgi:uncharacterized protein (TIGR02996 family)